MKDKTQKRHKLNLTAAFKEFLRAWVVCFPFSNIKCVGLFLHQLLFFYIAQNFLHCET